MYQNLINKNTEFSFSVIEPSRYWMKISYPQNWDEHSATEREALANEISSFTGQYLAHTSVIWHEIVTWYGFSSAGIFPETISAFSWEDTYSDIMGIWLGAAALRDEQQRYDDIMTELLYQELKGLDAMDRQSKCDGTISRRTSG